MRRLILLRHGKAEIVGLTGGDRERPLAARGRAESAMTAQWLSVAGFSPDLVYMSPSMRTRSTWECASAVFTEARTEVVEALYLAGLDTLLEVLEDAPEVETIMVVGHNPGLQELGLHLAIEGGASPDLADRIAQGFPTASAYVFRMGEMRGEGVEAVFEPPGRAGGEPRWAFFGGRAGEAD